MHLSLTRILAILSSLVFALTLPPILVIHSSFASGMPSISSAPQASTIVIGVVTLTDVLPGEETSASVTTDPQKYQGIPGLRVVKAEIPKAQTGEHGATEAVQSTASLKGVVVDMGDGREQSADTDLIVNVPINVAFIPIIIALADRPEQPIARGTVPVNHTMPPRSDYSGSTPTPAEPVKSSVMGAPQTPVVIHPKPDADRPMALPPAVAMPPVVVAGGVQVMHGQTVGNSTKMKILVDGIRVKILAAKPGTLFWDVPKTLSPGRHQVTIWPGPRAEPVDFVLYVLGFIMAAGNTHLLRGQSTQMHVTITGLEDLPASAWESAKVSFDLVDVESLRQRVNGFRTPQPGERGTVAVILENRSPNTVRMGKRGDFIVLTLHQEDFAHGPYTYEDKLQSVQSGSFDIEGTVVAFLNPIAGQPSN